MTTQDGQRQYICPGESHPISHAVHLSRLAAYYPSCRTCPYRTETGQIDPQVVEKLQETEKRVERTSLFTKEGVRGIHRNELTRSKATQLATAMANLLWKQTPIRVQSSGNILTGRFPVPVVIVGYDERPSSPDLVAGVVSGLRRMGCQVIDLAVTTRPCLSFTVHHLNATAGIMITGSGCAPSWTGIDFVGKNGLPLSQPDLSFVTQAQTDDATLRQVEDLLNQPISRPTRQSGSLGSFQAFVPYEAGLWKHFHALRPLRIVCASSSPLVRQLTGRIFDKLPCEVDFVDLPLRQRALHDVNDADVVRVSEKAKEFQAHIGVLIDDDGAGCSFFDEKGKVVSPQTITCLIADRILADQPGCHVAIESLASPLLAAAITKLGGIRVEAGHTHLSTATAMRGHNAPFAGGLSGRYWFWDAYPVCDALVSMARVLESLSQSDAPFSQVAASFDVSSSTRETPNFSV